ncbi:MAG: hypothetical protein KGS48_18420 [Bacteroidetes bacterium]|nr:hypothetical protein [Bacteroidota bacterium]
MKDIIKNEIGNSIGEWSAKRINCIQEFIPYLCNPNCEIDLKTIASKINSIVTFPAMELINLQIYDEEERRKGYGRTANNDFLANAKSADYGFAVAQIGFVGVPNDFFNLRANIQFYLSCGWHLLSNIADNSLKIAYCKL